MKPTPAQCPKCGERIRWGIDEIDNPTDSRTQEAVTRVAFGALGMALRSATRKPVITYHCKRCGYSYTQGKMMRKIAPLLIVVPCVVIALLLYVLTLEAPDTLDAPTPTDYSAELQVTQDYLVLMNYFKRIEDLAEETAEIVDGISMYSLFVLSDDVSADNVSFLLEDCSTNYIPPLYTSIQSYESEINGLLGTMSTDTANDNLLLASDYLADLRSNIDNLNGMITALSAYNIIADQDFFDDYRSYRTASEELTNQIDADAYLIYINTLAYIQATLNSIS